MRLVLAVVLLAGCGLPEAPPDGARCIRSHEEVLVMAKKRCQSCWHGLVTAVVEICDEWEAQ